MWRLKSSDSQAVTASGWPPDISIAFALKRCPPAQGGHLLALHRRTGNGLQRTVTKYLRSGAAEPHYGKHVSPSKLDPYAEKLSAWLKSETGKSRKQRHTLKQLHAALVARWVTPVPVQE